MAGCSGCTSGASGGCGCEDKKAVFDWLGNLIMPGMYNTFNIVEVRFKGGQKEYYRNVTNIELFTGDKVTVEGSSGGHHIGTVSLQGDLVRLQLKKKNITPNSDKIKQLYRLSTDSDLDIYNNAKAREMPALFRTRQIVQELKLDMKVSDIEFQADNTKATFFYTSEGRVDFRELIKCLAREFKIRVEMRQISLRQETGRLGGIGTCGRELCCSSWINKFKSVGTSAARYQNLSLNPQKLSGQCGRLKCCLNYELDTYVAEIKSMPQIKKPLQTEKGQAFVQKVDIFKKIIYLNYEGEKEWHPVAAERVRIIQEMNDNGQKAPALIEIEELEQQPGGEAALNYDLSMLDKKYTAQKKKKAEGKRRSQNRNRNRNKRKNDK